MHQYGHQERRYDEIGNEQCGKEPAATEGPAKVGQGHLQECHEQHECKRRVDATLKRCRAGYEQSDKRSQHNGREVNADLVPLDISRMSCMSVFRSFVSI